MSIAPAPWKTGPINYADVYDADGNVIALVPKGFEWTVDTARLIVAAPDLLKALKLIWSMFDDGRIVRNITNDHQPDWALKMLNFTRELQTIQSAIAKAEAPPTNTTSPSQASPEVTHAGGKQSGLERNK